MPGDVDNIRQHWGDAKGVQHCQECIRGHQDYTYLVSYLRDIGRHWGMIGNTKKMPKTLEQGWGDLKVVKHCWQNIGRCGELLILILLFLTMIMGH